MRARGLHGFTLRHGRRPCNCRMGDAADPETAIAPARTLTPGRGRGETLPSMDRSGVRHGPRTSSGDVVPFPPLARTPPPPRSRFDPRQANVARIVGALLDAVGGSAGTRPTNLATGFRASAVDVGRVKAIVEAGIAAFDMHQVKARWKRDVRAWMVGTLRAWVQRCKLIRLRPREAGIRVELQTQDDEATTTTASTRSLDVVERGRRAQTDAGTAPDP